MTDEGGLRTTLGGVGSDGPMSLGDGEGVWTRGVGAWTGGDDTAGGAAGPSPGAGCCFCAGGTGSPFEGRDNGLWSAERGARSGSLAGAMVGFALGKLRRRSKGGLSGAGGGGGGGGTAESRTGGSARTCEASRNQGRLVAETSGVGCCFSIAAGGDEGPHCDGCRGSPLHFLPAEEKRVSVGTGAGT